MKGKQAAVPPLTSAHASVMLRKRRHRSSRCRPIIFCSVLLHRLEFTQNLGYTQVKSIVFRYIMAYYNRQRIYSANPGGLPPAMYRQAARGLAA